MNVCLGAIYQEMPLLVCYVRALYTETFLFPLSPPGAVFLAGCYIRGLTGSRRSHLNGMVLDPVSNGRKTEP